MLTADWERRQWRGCLVKGMQTDWGAQESPKEAEYGRNAGSQRGGAWRRQVPGPLRAGARTRWIGDSADRRAPWQVGRYKTTTIGPVLCVTLGGGRSAEIADVTSCDPVAASGPRK